MPARDVPRLATDVELIGRFEDSGFKEPPYLARRKDGQIVQLAPVLYALAEEIDGRRDTAQIAEALSHRIRRGVDAQMVEMLLDGQLRRLGLVAQSNGVTAEVAKLDPLLALRFRARVVPSRFVRGVTTVFRPLFWPPVMVAVVAGILAADVWLFGVHGISQGLRHVIYQPALVLMLLAGVIVATAFHELGHATALRYGGGEPGVMGVGVYIVWPAFYTDITDSYRLGKWGRLRADTGGMYFNAIFALGAVAAYVATGFEPLLLLVVLQNFAIIQQSLPLLRLDGYYIVSDLTGVPDILGRIGPVLRALLPWRRADDRVTALKPWVRAAVTAYVVVLVPVLVVAFLLMLVHAPRLFATAWDSLALHYQRLGHESGGMAATDVLQMAVLVLPCLGILATTWRFGARAWRWSDGRPGRRAPLAFGTATAVAFLGLLWWPHGDYRPISPHDRGTVVGAVKSLPATAGGRVSATIWSVERPIAHAVRHRPFVRTTTTTTTTTTTGAPGQVQARSAPWEAGSWDATPWAQTTTGAPPVYGPPDPQPSAGPAPAAPPPGASSPSSSPSNQGATTTQTTPAQTTTTDTTPSNTTTTDTTTTQTTRTQTTTTDTTTTQTTPTQTTTTPP